MARIGAAVVAVGVVLAAGGRWWVGPVDTWPWLVRWLGPPRTDAEERHAAVGTATVDTADLDGLLADHVRDGWVDYRALAADPRLARVVASFDAAPWDALSRDDKLALAINAYNVFTLQLIVDHLPLASIQDIPAAQRWDAPRWSLGGRRLSLSELEHQIVRAEFVEPRVHFALNCASVGCPPLRGEAYTGARLEAQLNDQALRLHRDPRWVRLEGQTAHITKLYAWYADDFARVDGDVLRAAGRWQPALREGDWTVRWLEYDWSLNGL